MADPTTNRASQLQALASQFPAANQKVAANLAAQNTNQLQQSIAGVGQGTSNTVMPSQAIGTAATQAAGQASLQQQQQATNQGVQLGQLGLEARGTQLKGEAAQRQLASQSVYNDYAQKLNNLDQSVKNKLLDSQLQFKTDQAGRTLLNERQMMDYAVAKSKSDQDFARYQQTAQEAWAKKLYALNVAQAKIQQALQQEYTKDKQAQDQDLIKRLTAAQVDAQKNLARQQANARNKMAAWQAGGTVLGAGLGAGIGSVLPGVGTALGASVGGSLGGALGSLGSIFE